MRTSPPLSALLIVAFGLALGPSALAQPEGASRKAARVLAEEGLALYDKKKFAAALERFDKADAVVSVPTVDLFAARCLAQLGRLMEASARYLDVINAEVADDAPQAFKTAQIEAKQERAALLPRLAAIAFAIEGGAEGATITLNGKELDPATFGEVRPLDPGSHRVEGKRAGASVIEEVTLAEGEKRTVTLKLPKPSPPPSTQPPPSKDGSGRWLRTAGIIGMGIGGAGLAVWGVTGGIALMQRSDLEDRGCRGGDCPAGVDAGSYSALRVTSMIGLYSGIGFAGAGTLLFLLAPSPSKSTGAARIEPWVGAGSAGVRGAF
ncbi:MAG: tetratricopeptide repeat protein [Polyangiaceae bacterium]|nr:tetratricopeptide repeat protein [Polyangiaceae bacterium]